MAKILLADDSTHAQRMGAKILSAEGFEVTTVSNGQAAVQQMKHSVPDLVVADVFMPGRNGYELCRFVKSDSNLKHVPVLLIIGAMEPYDPEEGKRVGADGLITKPLESSNLVATVQDLLAAAKRFAPSRAQSAKEAAAAEPPPEEITAPEEPPEWAAEEEIPATGPEKFEIPQEMSQQAVSMFTDLLGGSESSDVPPMATLAPPVMDSAIPEIPLSQPEPLPSMADAGKTVWTAELATITEQEEKLFEQPGADWRDLTHLAEENLPPLAAPKAAPVETLPTPFQEPAMAAPAPEASAPETPSPAEGADSFSPPDLAGPPPPESQPVPVAASTTVDPFVLEQLVRGAVEQWMPEIIERVKQSLKS